MTGPLAVLLALAAAGPNLCTVCHPDVRVQFERSIHSIEEVSCAACHGGQPSAAAMAAAHSGRFRGAIPRRDVPALCASCHADNSRMRGYNLPTDQLALYETSAHGRGLARGDDRTAVCTDCHGVHEILPPEDPRSPVFARNIPATCARCHADQALMARYGHGGDPHSDYVAGVHGQALLQKDLPSAPQCSSCHGAHGAAPPGVGDVGKTCGQCHATARGYFQQGPHRAAMAAAGLPECASCHHEHLIRKADVTMLDTVCQTCHASGSPPLELARQMRTLYSAAAEQLDQARQVVDRAAAVPLYVEDYEARLEEGRTSLVESLPAMHSLDLALVEQMTHRARAIGAEVQSEMTGKLDSMKWRRVFLILFWFYLLVTVGILVRYRRRAGREAAG